MEVLAKRLKELREKERYSQKQIAERIGMSAGGYQKIEQSQRDPKLDVLVMLCDIFNVSADYLLGRSNLVNNLAEKAFDVLMAYNNTIIADLHYLNAKEKNGKDSPSAVNAHGNYLQVKGHYDQLFYNYLVEYFYQPNPNPFTDSILKDKYPIEFVIKEDSVSGFGAFVSAICADGYELGRIKSFTGGIGLDFEYAKEKAETYIEEMKIHLKLDGLK